MKKRVTENAIIQFKLVKKKEKISMKKERIEKKKKTNRKKI